MMKKQFLLFLLCLCCVTAVSARQKSDRLRPRWLTSELPTPQSPSYFFLDASGTGGTLEEARQRSFVNLSTRLEHERGIKVSSTMQLNSTSVSEGGAYNEQVRQTYQMKCVENGREVSMTTRIIDEYWERDANGYLCYVLYTVANNNSAGGSSVDDIRLTTSYGAKGFFYSLVPGAGQLYKGSKLKGGLIMGGTAAGAGMIVVAESMRSSYVKKMQEKPENMEFYNNEAGNWENIRNGFIGATVALYVYNLIDAAVSPGRRRVVVKKEQRASFSLQPTWNTEYTGMSLVMNF